MQFSRFGGPEVLAEAEVPDPVAGPGQVVVEVEAAGVNFADIGRIAGTYTPPERLPAVPGMEVLGRTGDGRRVMAYMTDGGYASRAVVNESDLAEVPEGLGAGEALALLVQGLTAWHLLRSSARMGAGESVVVNAGAGGVGSLAVQLAREFGAGRVIATASTDAKRALAVELGADAAVDGAVDGYWQRVLEANGGRPVDIVLDAVGGPMLDAALSALAPFGRLITYGSSSGEGHPGVQPGLLAQGNVSLGGLWLAPLMAAGPEAAAPLGDLLRLTAEGRVRPLVGAEYALADAATALQDLRDRRTTGKIVLRVEG